jgi:hypothetical protein
LFWITPCSRLERAVFFWVRPSACFMPSNMPLMLSLSAAIVCAANGAVLNPAAQRDCRFSLLGSALYEVRAFLLSLMIGS